MKFGFRPLSLCLSLFAAQAFPLPKATEIYSKMGFGINIGNTMEVPGDPTAWGNPYPTAAYVDSLKAAGFSTVRIPCAWDSHAQSNTISTSWLDSVQTVVDRVLSTGAFAILNIHWDGGWFEENVGTSVDASIQTKLQCYWTQIAERFKDYNERLLFAGANEPGLNSTWNGSMATTLKSYYSTFVSAVRGTGGNNGTRTLIVQAPMADIAKSDSLYNAGYDVMPSDPSGLGYLMFEPHFYPYSWALMESDADWGYAYYYWGQENYQSDDYVHNTGWNLYANGYTHWCNSVYIDSMFAILKKDYFDRGFPVIIGEFGSIKRISQLSGNATRLDAHYKSRGRYYGYVAKAAKSRGIVPIAWDTGDEGDQNFTIVRRQISKFGGTDGQVIDTAVLNGMRNAYGLGDYSNSGVTHVNDFISTPPNSSAAGASSSSGAAATLTKCGAGSQFQQVESGAAIVSFCYTWENATSVSYKGFPETFSIEIDDSAKKITIGGNVPSVEEPTVYAYTVSTVGGETTASKSGKISVTVAGVGASSNSAESSSSAAETSSSSEGTTRLAEIPDGSRGLRLENGTLSSSNDIFLFDANGNTIGKAIAGGAEAQISLQGIRRGIYVAKSGAEILKIRLR